MPKEKPERQTDEKVGRTLKRINQILGGDEI